MPRNHNIKSTAILNRISRIFHHKEHDDKLTAQQQLQQQQEDILISSLHSNNSPLPILLQRAPSSKLLIEDDLMNSTIPEHSHSYSDIFESTTTNNKKKQQQPNRQSWFSTISKFKSTKGGNHKNKRKSSSVECWFVTQPQQQQQERGEFSIEISDQQMLQKHNKKEEGAITIRVEEDEVKRMEIASPLSITSSLNSTNTTARPYNTNNTNHHHLSSSYFWSPLEREQEGSTISTARTSIDSQLLQIQKQHNNKSCISLAENVKNILGDAILLADKELNI